MAYGGGKETIYPRAKLFLRNANVNTTGEARNLSSLTLQAANKAAQNATPFNVVYFGPVADGDLLLDILPGSYSEEKYKNFSLIAANHQDEARFLGNQSNKYDSDFDNWVCVPSASTTIRNQIFDDIYPAKYRVHR